MNAQYEVDADREHQLELIELLDERSRLRDDPTRRYELEQNHARLRQKLHDAVATENSGESSDTGASAANRSPAGDRDGR